MSPDQSLSSVDSTWHRFRRTTKAFLVEVEGAISAVTMGRAAGTTELQVQAALLARDFGGFGLSEAALVAEQLHRTLQGLSPRSAGACARAAGQVRLELDRYQPQAQDGLSYSSADGDATSILVVSRQTALLDRLSLLMAGQGYRVQVASSVAELAQVGMPMLILLDSQFERELSATLNHAQSLGERFPTVSIALLSDDLNFRLRLEAARANIATVLDREPGVEQILEALGRGQAQLEAKKGRVLLVEDEIVSRKVLQRVLQGAGYEVITCENAASFWRELEEASPDILMLDYLLPGANGIEICRVVRSDPRFSSIPILFLTASKDPDVLSEIHSAGGDDVLVKPVVGSELVNRIQNRVLRAREMRLRGDVDFHLGIPGQRQSLDTLALLIKLAHRQESPVSVLLFRIDPNAVLPLSHTLASVMASAVAHFKESLRRPGDLVGRWSDDCLVVGLFDTPRDQALKLVDSILQTFRSFLGKGARVATQASLVTFPADGADLAALLLTVQALLQKAAPNKISSPAKLETST